MKIKDLEFGGTIRALFKGPPGTGKTVAAGSFPHPYFLSVDGKVGSLKLFYPHGDIEYDIFNDFWSVFQKLEELQRNCPYKTVVVDGLTKLSLMAMMHSMKYRPEERGKDGDKNKDVKGHKRGELLLPEIEDYGAESMGLYQLIFKLEDLHARLNVNTILIAHVLEIEYEDLQHRKRKVQTLLTGGKKIAAGIPGEFDEIFHFELGRGLTADQSTGYHVLTHGDGDNFARTALPLPHEIDITDRTDFYDILMRHAREHEADKA